MPGTGKRRIRALAAWHDVPEWALAWQIKALPLKRVHVEDIDLVSLIALMPAAKNPK
jgi:hypothetical protein